jgi:hypothetical protein
MNADELIASYIKLANSVMSPLKSHMVQSQLQLAAAAMAYLEASSPQAKANASAWKRHLQCLLTAANAIAASPLLTAAEQQQLMAMIPPITLLDANEAITPVRVPAVAAGSEKKPDYTVPPR